MHKFSAQQIQYLRDIALGRSYAEIAEQFNAYFALDLRFSQIRAALKNHKICNGRDCRFPPGQIPFNKGRKGVHYSPATEFKPGQIPVNHRPVGSERINVDGYIEIKTAEPRTWRPKHRVVWETEHGPIPKGHAVIFADGNKLNCDSRNLILITRAQLGVINKHGLRYGDKETAETVVNIADLQMAISAASKRRKQR